MIYLIWPMDERHHIFNQMATSENAVQLWDDVYKKDTVKGMKMMI